MWKKIHNLCVLIVYSYFRGDIIVFVKVQTILVFFLKNLYSVEKIRLFIRASSPITVFNCHLLYLQAVSTMTISVTAGITSLIPRPTQCGVVRATT